MVVLALAARSAQPVEVDHCAACHLVWFDPLESVRLAGLGWVQLLRRLQCGSTEPAAPEPSHWACPTCSGPLHMVRNLTRFGRFAALECRAGHGHLHSQLGMLSERGLVRPLRPAERQWRQQSGRHSACLNCGAEHQPGLDACAHCGSPVVAIDLARLADALAVPAGAQPATLNPTLLLAWPCSGCGSPVDPTSQTRCIACGSAIVAIEWPQLTPLLDAAEEALTPPPPRPYRARPPRSPRGWRDTQLQALREIWRDERSLWHDGQGLTPAGWVGAALLLVLAWWLLR